MSADVLPLSKTRSRRVTKRETTRAKYPTHMKWLKTLPCIITGETGVVRHHLQHAELSAGGAKSGDQWAVPIVNRLHCAQHAGSIHSVGVREAEWWAQRGIDPLAIAKRLFDASIAAGRVGGASKVERAVAAAYAGDIDRFIARGYHGLVRAA
jgi:hypothetical protein